MSLPCSLSSLFARQTLYKKGQENMDPIYHTMVFQPVAHTSVQLAILLIAANKVVHDTPIAICSPLRRREHYSHSHPMKIMPLALGNRWASPGFLFALPIQWTRFAVNIPPCLASIGWLSRDAYSDDYSLCTHAAKSVKQQDKKQYCVC